MHQLAAQHRLLVKKRFAQGCLLFAHQRSLRPAKWTRVPLMAISRTCTFQVQFFSLSGILLHGMSSCTFSHVQCARPKCLRRTFIAAWLYGNADALKEDSDCMRADVIVGG